MLIDKKIQLHETTKSEKYREKLATKRMNVGRVNCSSDETPSPFAQTHPTPLPRPRLSLWGEGLTEWFFQSESLGFSQSPLWGGGAAFLKSGFAALVILDFLFFFDSSMDPFFLDGHVTTVVWFWTNNPVVSGSNPAPLILAVQTKGEMKG